MSGDSLSSAISSTVRPQDAVRVERTRSTENVDERKDVAVESGNTVPATELERSVPDQEVEQAVSHINEFIQSIRRELEFRIDEETGRVVVTVKNAETEEVIRTIPRTDVVRIADQLEEGSPVILSAEI